MGKLCISCMNNTMNENGICTSCDFVAGAPRKTTQELPLTTSLKARYMVGKVLGQGGFGITYVGFDIKKKRKVAIKEYFPSSYADRETSSNKHTVYSHSSEEKLAVFNRGLDRFIKEGQRLSKFSNTPGIVTVYDMFKENGTFYIVMEFVDGSSLKQTLKKEGGKLPEEKVLALLKPVITSLAFVHSEGLIHRDIAPDNIMIQPDGTAKLIDFGAASESLDDGVGTIAMHKPGYAPEEQYDTTGHQRQGTWTDVYALSATIFRAIEGKIPPDAMTRMRNSHFDGFTVPVRSSTKNAIMHGLALYKEDRTQNMFQLFSELYPGEHIVLPEKVVSQNNLNNSNSQNNLHNPNSQNNLHNSNSQNNLHNPNNPNTPPEYNNLFKDVEPNRNNGYNPPPPPRKSGGCLIGIVMFAAAVVSLLSIFI